MTLSIEAPCRQQAVGLRRVAAMALSLALHLVFLGTLLAVTLLEENLPLPALAVETLRPSRLPPPPAGPKACGRGYERLIFRFHGNLRQVIPNRIWLSSFRPVLRVLLSWLGPDSRTVLGMISIFLTQGMRAWNRFVGSRRYVPAPGIYYYSNRPLFFYYPPDQQACQAVMENI